MQQCEANRDSVTVTDSKVAQWLMNAENAKCLAHFSARAITVSEAAAQLALNANQAYKLIKRLEKLGLVHVERYEPRRGKPLRYYRTLASEFFIPPKVIPLEEFLYEVSCKLERTLSRRLANSFSEGREGKLGLRVVLKPTNRVSLQLAEKPGSNWNPVEASSPLDSVWEQLFLDYEDAKDLQRELATLLEKYKGKSGKHPYVLRFALAPGTAV